MEKINKRMNNVLVIRLSALGDVAMTIPVLYSLAEAYPKTSFTILTQPAASRLYINHPENISVLPIDVRETYKGMGGMIKLFRELRKDKFDAVADLHNVLRSNVLDSLFYLSGTNVARINKGRREKKKLTDIHKKEKKQLKTSFQRYKDVFSKLGFEFPDTFTSIFSEKTNASFGILPNPEPHIRYIGIAPFAKHDGKIYPLTMMQQVIAELTRNENYRIYLFGSEGEEAQILQDWANSFPHIHSFAGKKLGFAMELSVMSKMNVMITMDSANMHLASLVGTPVVSIWGATHPFAGFLGWNQDKDNALTLNMSCSPCSVFGNKPCYRKDYACMTHLSPASICKHIDSILANIPDTASQLGDMTEK